MNAAASVNRDLQPADIRSRPHRSEVCGRQATIDGEQYVCITNVDALPPFLMSVVSSGDQWLFVGSNTPFTSGRINPDGGMFPYQTVDKLLRHADSSGAITIFQVRRNKAWTLWEPWNPAVPAHRLTRNLYKHVLGTDVLFEEINHDLGLRFVWELSFSETYGLVRHCRLENITGEGVEVRYLDGLHNLIPPGLNHETYARFSNLGQAYMRHECIHEKSLGIFTMNSGFADRAEPCESLRSAAVWSLGHKHPTVLLSTRQVDDFRYGGAPVAESEIRGEFGAYLIADEVGLAPAAVHDWYVVGDTRLDHTALVNLGSELADPEAIKARLLGSVAANRRGLLRKIACADGLQQTADAATCVHHFANTLFNCMRGGTLENSYRFPAVDFSMFLKSRNTTVLEKHRPWLDALPSQLTLAELQALAAKTGDPHLQRLAGEYLPLTFSRRHGDPSRPWNYFSISVKDAAGAPVYGYQGNWRDIFQNWEGLAQSYPDCIGSMIAVFLNASTADGYNPLHVTREGLSWDTWEPDNVWSYIGYWGDHQIIYLLRLLECSEQFHPGRLSAGLATRMFTYAQVPYVIKGFADLELDPRNSVTFNRDLHANLMKRAAGIGNDGKLFRGSGGDALLVSLAEKLLVPLLAKLSNLVPGGGIWMNTQRPEWNDGNNALAGWGLSMVTVFHLRRYLVFLEELFSKSGGEPLAVSAPLAPFVTDLTEALRAATGKGGKGMDDAVRYRSLAALGKAGEKYRAAVYGELLEDQATLAVPEIRDLLAAALQAIDETIRANRRGDGMFHSYNNLQISAGKASVQHLTLMLEGQVAVLASRLLSPVEALHLLKAMRNSTLYRADQNSYMLNPDRRIAPLLTRNTLPDSAMKAAPVLAGLVEEKESTVVSADKNGALHFQADLTNAADLSKRLDRLAAGGKWKAGIERDRQAILDLWEQVFHHSEFTGRSGTMFGFEGLGCIYWHMVAKLLLAVQETHQRASAADASTIAQLAGAYYDIRNGLGFTKTPAVYGAFPTDPYSHTPGNRGAQQPGMTGQVKEEILTRMGELGVTIREGRIHFTPVLLRTAEFMPKDHSFEYIGIDGDAHSWSLPEGSLAFTFCQTPVAYILERKAVGANAGAISINIERRGGRLETLSCSSLSDEDSRAVFNRTGLISTLTVRIPAGYPGVGDFTALR